MTEDTLNADVDSHHERAIAIVRSAITDTTDADRAALLAWATELLEIRESDLPVAQKTRLAIRATATAEVAAPLVQGLARQGKSLGIQTKNRLWDDRGWVARTGLAGAAAGAAVFGGQGAGIAALGGAVGVPLWLVFGAGGAVLGSLIEELTRQSPPTTAYTVIEARPIDAGGEPNRDFSQDAEA